MCQYAIKYRGYFHFFKTVFTLYTKFIKDKTSVRRLGETLIYNGNFRQGNFQLNYQGKKVR